MKRAPVDPVHIRALRVGHGANCSSVGSVIDTLFASAVVGTALFAAIAAAISREEVRVVGEPEPGPGPAPTTDTEPDEERVP